MIAEPLGSATGKTNDEPNYETGDICYPSTIDPIGNLHAKYAYYTNAPKLPVVVLVHGFVENANSMTSCIMEDMAHYGLFAVSVGMRGRNGASGAPDVSGRELHDIYDLVRFLKANFSDVVDPDNIHCSGYSGGGGNVLGLAVKFPDTFQNYVAHFGISDYGYEEQIGWWYTHPSRQTVLTDWIGFTPDTNPGAYRSRAHHLGVGKNLQGGKLWVFHDQDDSSVSVSQSQAIADGMDLESNPRYMLSITDETDRIRWLHNSPHADAPVRNSRNYWGPTILNGEIDAWTMPASGSVFVQGYMVTKRFSVWLGNGQEHVAELVYDTRKDSYRVTPLSGAVEVSITQDGKSATQTVNGETTITVS